MPDPTAGMHRLKIQKITSHIESHRRVRANLAGDFAHEVDRIVLDPGHRCRNDQASPMHSPARVAAVEAALFPLFTRRSSLWRNFRFHRPTSSQRSRSYFTPGNLPDDYLLLAMRRIYGCVWWTGRRRPWLARCPRPCRPGAADAANVALLSLPHRGGVSVYSGQPPG
jgi:hypothetical protein